MALVPYITAEELDARFQPLLARPINLFRAFANSPEALEQFHPFGEWIRWECELDGRQRELLILQVGYLTSSEYEWSHHVEIAQKFGVTEADIDGIIALARGGDAPSLSEQDRLLLTAAAELTTDRVLKDSTAEALIAQFGNARYTDIVVVAAFYSMVVRVLGGLRVDVEPSYQHYLTRFPLPSAG